MADDSTARWLDQPTEFKLAMLANLEHAVELSQKKSALLNELRRSLIHHWMQGEPINMNITEKDFITLVAAYYKAIEEGRDTFLFKGQPTLVAYAKYLIEYLEPQLVAVSKHAFVNNLERRLRDIRREHARVMRGETA